MITHYSFCEYHLGDQIVHLNFLRKLATANPQHRFCHFMHDCYMAQMSDVVCDIPTIELHSLEDLLRGEDVNVLGPGYRNVWKNADGGYWERHPLRNDYSNFYVAFFAKLASEMGLESPIKQPSDLLFDYPKLLEPAWPGEEFDYLVINSRPCSGQFMAYDKLLYFDPLIEKLVKAGKRVVVTQDTSVCEAWVTSRNWRHDRPELSITQIGNLSLRCKNIIAVATSPMFPCMNAWQNPEKRFVIGIDCPERNIIWQNARYCRSLAEIEREVGL